MDNRSIYNPLLCRSAYALDKGFVFQDGKPVAIPVSECPFVVFLLFDDFSLKIFRLKKREDVKLLVQDHFYDYHGYCLVICARCGPDRLKFLFSYRHSRPSES